MSFMIIECPWCGETYTFGVVGMTLIGSGHGECKGSKTCEEGSCEEPATVLIQRYVRSTDDTVNRFVCEAHWGPDDVLMTFQPGLAKQSES